MRASSFAARKASTATARSSGANPSRVNAYSTVWISSRETWPSAFAIFANIAPADWQNARTRTARAAESPRAP